MNFVNSHGVIPNDKNFGVASKTSTDPHLLRAVPYPTLNTSAFPGVMATIPNGRSNPNRSQPHRTGPAPSTISTSSSTSSNATVRPQATTPRALSPTSGQIPLPIVRVASIRASMLPGAKKAPLNRHPHWDDPAKVAQDIALLDEKSVLEGLSWRLEQYLDIQPPYGLLVPEMVEAARQDPNDVCGPALDMLMSAIFADGDPPVCEIPRVQTDSSGNQYADYTVLLTSKNSPDALKTLFISWAGVVQRLKSLDPRFHSEIARIICDMEPLENPLLPQVMLIAHDLKVIAKDISFRRGFLAKFDAAFLQMIKESDGGTLPAFRRNRTILDSVGEAAEPPSSSSSRSSSRSSHRSRHRAHSLSNSRREKVSLAGEGDPNGLSARGPPSGLRSRSNSVHSLRLGKDGVPLSDAELVAEGIATGPEPRGSSLQYMSGRPLENNQRPGQNSNAVDLSRPSSRSGTYEYGTIAPLTIPAFSSDNSTLDSIAPLSQLRHLGHPNQSIQSHPTPVSPSGVPRLNGEDMPIRPLPTPVASSIDIAASAPLPPKSRGPRPLPPKPARSPKTDTSPQQPPPPPPLTHVRPSTSRQGGIDFSFVVPNQGGSSSPLAQSMSIQIPVQPVAGFVVPSATDISDVVEVPSSSPHDLQAARQRYAMESSSGLPYMDERFPNMLRQRRHGQVDMSAFNVVDQYGMPARPATTEPGGWSGSSRIPQPHHRGEQYNPPRSSSSASNYGMEARRIGGSGWAPPSDWNEPPPPPPKEKESHGLFSGVKTWLRRDDSKGNTASPSQEVAYPPRSSALAYHEGGDPRQSTSTSPSIYSIPSQPVVRPMVDAPSTSSQPSAVSPGFADLFQANPVAAREYYGAGSSSRSHNPSRGGASKHDPYSSQSPPEPPNADLVTIRETMYGAIADSLSTPALRQVMAKDEQRAYFSAVSLAILNVSMTLQSSADSENVVHMMSREIRLSALPGAYKTCMAVLAAIGREARKLSEEDDERAIAYVARGRSLPEPRVGRVRRLLERGVGYVGADGRVRGAGSGQGGTGRSREFSNKINQLALDMMKLPAFQEQMLRILKPGQDTI